MTFLARVSSGFWPSVSVGLTRVSTSLQGSYSDLYPDSDDSSEDQIENSKNSWSCKVPPFPRSPAVTAIALRLERFPRTVT